jgi:hypothetical protein
MMETDDDPLLNQRRREECERKARRGEMDPRLGKMQNQAINHHHSSLSLHFQSSPFSC